MEVPNDVIYNFLVDLKKKDIDVIDRARIIRKYCEEQNLSIRALSEELGMSHSTLQDWVDYERVDKKEYKELLTSGYSKKSIYKMLRDTRGNRKQFDSITKTELNVIMKDANMKLIGFVNDPTYDNETLDILHELRNTLNRIELHVEKKMKMKK